MPFWKWSKTAATNASADGTINWAEGQPPSSVNDSARAMMARLAEYRDDISGAIITAGSATAYTVSSNQGFDSFAHMDGAMIAFTPHATNTGTITLNVDGLGAKPLRSATGIEIPASSLILGTPYVATYYNTAGEWILQGTGFSNPFIIPIGAIIDYTAASPPNSNFVLPYGQAISRTTYATLYSLISTTFGAGDGSTTFNLPDLRGRVSAGKDDMGGSAAGRITIAGSGINGGAIGSGGGAETKTISQANLPSVNLTVTIPSGQGSHAHGVPGGGANNDNYGSGNGVEGARNSQTTDPATLPALTGTAALGGSGAAFQIAQPTLILSKIMRVI